MAELPQAQYKWYSISWTNGIIVGGIGNTTGIWSHTVIYRIVPNLPLFRYLSLGLAPIGGTAQWILPVCYPTQCKYIITKVYLKGSKTAGSTLYTILNASKA